MIQYYGGPITPDPCAIEAWKGRHAFISYYRPEQLEIALVHAASFAFDNGEYSFWKAGKPRNWEGYYEFVARYINHPRFDFAIIPDVIGGTEEENDAYIRACPFPDHKMAVVWHINESIERLIRLAHEHRTVCIGSSGEFDVKFVAKFLERAKFAISHIVDQYGYPICRLHGLRMLNPAIFTQLPLTSGDSTNIARNIGIDKAWRGTYQPKSKITRTKILVERTEYFNSAESLDYFGSLIG